VAACDFGQAAANAFIVICPRDVATRSPATKDTAIIKTLHHRDWLHGESHLAVQGSGPTELGQVKGFIDRLSTEN